MIRKIKKETDADTELLLVDDGSRDHTWQMISDAAKEHGYVHGIKLSHNRGHQNALWAGMEAAVDHCDAMVKVSMPTCRTMRECYRGYGAPGAGRQGYHLCVRKERKTDTFFKRFTAQAFYKLMQSVDKETVYNHADFRMMTNRTLKALMQYPERNLSSEPSSASWVSRGFVYYDRKAREAGERYPFTKMLSFSIDGITSFSVAPLKFITFLGLAMTLVAVIMIIFALVEYFQGKTIQGWTSMLVSMWFIGGIITTGCRHHGHLYRQDLYRGEASPTILHRRKSIILSKKENKKNINLIDTKIASVLIIPMLFLYLSLIINHYSSFV